MKKFAKHNLLQDVEILSFDKLKVGVQTDSIVLAKSKKDSECLKLIQQTQSKVVIQSERSDVENRILAGAAFLKLKTFQPKSYAAFLLDPLSNSQPETFEFEFKNPDQKTPIKEQLNRYFKSFSELSKGSQKSLAIADELLMNALYTAPREAAAKNIDLDRTPSSRLQVSHNSDYLAIACIDNYGSLDLSKLTNRLLDLYKSEGPLSPLLEDEGAGIGCKLIIQNSTDFFATCVTGQLTVVGCLTNLHYNLRKKTVLKNFFLSSYDKEAFC